MNLRWTAAFTLLSVLAGYKVWVQPPGARAAQNPPATVNAQQLQSVLLRVYYVRARIHDLLGLLQASESDRSGAERIAFQQKTATVDRELQTLETWRYRFYYRPQDADLGEKTLKALDDLIPDIREIRKAAAQDRDKGTTSQFEQAAAELSNLRNEITGYLEATSPGRFAPAAAATSAPGPLKSKSASTLASANPVSAPNVPASTRPAPTAATAPSVLVSAQAVHLEPQQVQKVLLDVYFASARIKDLLSLVQPQEWKMAGGERAAFQQQLQSVETSFANLEKWRYQFASHLQDTDSAANTVEAISKLLPQIQQIEAMLGQFEGRQAALQFKEPEKELESLNNTVASYLASLRATYPRQLAVAPPGSTRLQTERISAAAPPPPVQYLPAVTPPLTSAQVKAILYGIYSSVYRIRDLVTQEKPDTWNAPQPGRTAANENRASLLSEASVLEKWRSLFSEDPDNMYYAFQLYRSVQDLVQPLQAFSQNVDQYENASLASDYIRAARDVQARLSDLVPYMNFFLQRESQSIDLYQSDLAACQNRLTYAMHGFVRTAIPMANIVPDFKGKRVVHRKSGAPARRKPRHAPTRNSS